MLGHNPLWIPGTDHAGIATQIVVERRLAAQGHGDREDQVAVTHRCEDLLPQLLREQQRPFLLA